VHMWTQERGKKQENRESYELRNLYSSPNILTGYWLQVNGITPLKWFLDIISWRVKWNKAAQKRYNNAFL
jgi:hypothetical protein